MHPLLRSSLLVLCLVATRGEAQDTQLHDTLAPMLAERAIFERDIAPLKLKGRTAAQALATLAARGYACSLDADPSMLGPYNPYLACERIEPVSEDCNRFNVLVSVDWHEVSGEREVLLRQLEESKVDNSTPLCLFARGLTSAPAGSAGQAAASRYAAVIAQGASNLAELLHTTLIDGLGCAKVVAGSQSAIGVVCLGRTVRVPECPQVILQAEPQLATDKDVFDDPARVKINVTRGTCLLWPARKPATRSGLAPIPDEPKWLADDSDPLILFYQSRLVPRIVKVCTERDAVFNERFVAAFDNWKVAHRAAIAKGQADFHRDSHPPPGMTADEVLSASFDGQEKIARGEPAEVSARDCWGVLKELEDAPIEGR